MSSVKRSFGLKKLVDFLEQTNEIFLLNKNNNFFDANDLFAEFVE